MSAGIGYRLVAIGGKVAQKWGDTAVFVAVENDNEAALELYRRAGFRQVLDEAELPHRRAEATPRRFLCKSLNEEA